MADWYWEFPAGSLPFPYLYADRNGTLEKPWVLGPNRRGINEGALDISVFSPGDTLWILDNHTWSNFTNQAEFHGLRDVTVRGDYPGRPGHVTYMQLLDGTTNCTFMNFSCDRIRAGAADNLLFKGLHVSNGPVGFTTVQEEDMHNVTITECSFFNLPSVGISILCRDLVSRTNWTITHNHIYNVGVNVLNPGGDMEGIGIQRFKGGLVAYNYIHHCRYGINLWESGHSSVRDVLITDNVIHSIINGVEAWPSRGIFISGGSTVTASMSNITIQNNIISHVGKEGMRLQAPPNAVGLVVKDNVIINSNTEFGTPNSEFLIAPAEWQKSGNRFYPVYRSYNSTQSRTGYTRSWSL